MRPHRPSWSRLCTATAPFVLLLAGGCGGAAAGRPTVTVTASPVVRTAGVSAPAGSTTASPSPTSSSPSSSEASPSTTASSPSSSTSSPSATATGSQGVTMASFDRSAFDYLQHRKGAYGLAAVDLTSGRHVEHNPTQRCETASMVKLDVLLTLLLQHQDSGRELSGEERSLTHDMIVYSDNSATTRLWGRIGADGGVREANKRFGLVETEPGTSYDWGLTTTTAPDQVRLLRNLAGSGPLDQHSKDYALGLMGQVSDGQDWGVSAASPSHEAQLKNGWLPRSEGWVVTSAGRVRTGNGHDVLMAVVSCRGASQDASVESIEHLARMAAQALAS